MTEIYKKVARDYAHFLVELMPDKGLAEICESLHTAFKFHKENESEGCVGDYDSANERKADKVYRETDDPSVKDFFNRRKIVIEEVADSDITRELEKI